MPVVSRLVLMCLIAGVPQGGARAAEGQSSDSPNLLQAVDYALLPAEAANPAVSITTSLRAPCRLIV